MSTLDREDIVAVIKEHGSTTALIMFSGVQYYTGQFFDLQLITEVGHAHGCTVGFDLAPFLLSFFEILSHTLKLMFAVKKGSVAVTRQN